jgi:TPR repeat protein
MLGTMYREGLGVRRDAAAAVSWYRRAAEQDEPEAQCELAAMLANGRGAERDLVEAYMWFHLAARRFNAAERERNDIAARERDLLAERMVPAQISAAQKRAREFRPAGNVQANR